jgi:hypothetical protein
LRRFFNTIAQFTNGLSIHRGFYKWKSDGCSLRGEEEMCLEFIKKDGGSNERNMAEGIVCFCNCSAGIRLLKKNQG